MSHRLHNRETNFTLMAHYEHTIAVIGGGTAGLTVSRSAAAVGIDVAMIEGERIGGDCTWYGCIPTAQQLEEQGTSYQRHCRHGATAQGHREHLVWAAHSKDHSAEGGSIRGDEAGRIPALGCR